MNQAYFQALQAQALVRVANETVAARQLLVDQVTALAQSKLRSQVDVAFASVNLAQAKLLLIRAQDGVQQAFAELTRALGLDQQQTYKLNEEPMPPSPPADSAEHGGAGVPATAGTGRYAPGDENRPTGSSAPSMISLIPP